MEIIKFYRDKQVILSIEDCMSDRRNQKHYKIQFKLIPLNNENKAKTEEVLMHYMDVTDVKRICDDLKLRKFDWIVNNTETIQNDKVPAFKDLKGSDNLSRILTIYQSQNDYVIQITHHLGKKSGNGAVVPISGPKKKLYIKLTQEELINLVTEVRDYMNIKQIMNFKMDFANLKPISNSVVAGA